MNANTVSTSRLERVREGMTVVDESGKRLGRVKRLHMPTTELHDVRDVPDPLRTRLTRSGFIELEDSVLDGPDAYIPADAIADVNADTVRLRPATDAPYTTDSRGQTLRTASTPAMEEPMFRTRIGEPQYEVHSSGGVNRIVLIGAGGTTLLIGGVAGGWLYRRRQQRRDRLDARLHRLIDLWSERVPRNDPARIGAASGGLLMLLVLLQTLLNRSRGDAAWQPQADDAWTRAGRSAFEKMTRHHIPGGMFSLLLPVIVVALAIVLRRRKPDDRPTYIGTPGVESAAGRDRVRSGELPPEYGSERVRH